MENNQISYSQAKREYLKRRQQEIKKQNDNSSSLREKQTIATAKEKIK